jgi:hypothetical protein
VRWADRLKIAAFHADEQAGLLREVMAYPVVELERCCLVSKGDSPMHMSHSWLEESS